MVTSMPHKRLAAIAGLGVAAAIAAAIITQTGMSGAKRVTIGNGSVAVLSRPARGTDALPPQILSLPFAEKSFASATGGGSRLLRTEGPLQLYAVPGKGGGLCLIEVNAVAGTSGGTCADRSSLLTGSIYMADRREDGSDLWDVVGLVSDGHTYAEANGHRVLVQNNAFVLKEVAANEVTLGSPSATQTVEFRN